MADKVVAQRASDIYAAANTMVRHSFFTSKGVTVGGIVFMAVEKGEGNHTAIEVLTVGHMGVPADRDVRLVGLPEFDFALKLATVASVSDQSDSMAEAVEAAQASAAYHLGDSLLVSISLGEGSHEISEALLLVSLAHAKQISEEELKTRANPLFIELLATA